MEIFLIVLIEGFVTISLEILTLRQLTPVVGNSIVVTSIIIGIFLLFLAYGYRRGGLQDKNHKGILRRNFGIAAVGFGIGLSTLFIESFFYYAHFVFPSSLITLVIYLLLIISPIVYLLGQTVPITLNLWRNRKSVSVMGGEVLHVSTLGSFLGATITAIVLLNFFGVAWTIFIDFLLLIILICLLADKKKILNYSFFIICALGLVAYLNIGFEKKLFVATNNYANYQVITTNPDQKILMINDSYSSGITPDYKGFTYIEYVKQILFDGFQLANKKILVLGAGGFTLSAEKTNGNEFYYVDIDHQLKKIVKDHFLRQINGEFIAEDARYFLRKNNTLFDAIIVDVFSNKTDIAAHLLSLEYYLEIKNSLTPDGIAVMNIIAKPTFSDNYSKRVDNTIRQAFGNCTSTPLQQGDVLTNIIYVCKKSANENDRLIYNDNLNSSSWDFFAIKE